MTEPITGPTIPEVCEQTNGRIPEGHQIYEVSPRKVTTFACAKSPGQAALSVCTVRRVPHQEVNAALIAALCESAKREHGE